MELDRADGRRVRLELGDGFPLEQVPQLQRQNQNQLSGTDSVLSEVTETAAEIRTRSEFCWILRDWVSFSDSSMVLMGSGSVLMGSGSMFTFTVQSSLAEANHFPSGLKAKLLTASL